VKQNFKIFLKDKKIILETIFKEEKINRVKKGRINEMCNYKHNELINIKTKYTDVKTNKVFYVDDFYLVSSNSERIK
jgi:hypothetical protein